MIVWYINVHLIIMLGCDLGHSAPYPFPYVTWFSRREVPGAALTAALRPYRRIVAVRGTTDSQITSVSKFLSTNSPFILLKTDRLISSRSIHSRRSYISEWHILYSVIMQDVVALALRPGNHYYKNRTRSTRKKTVKAKHARNKKAQKGSSNGDNLKFVLFTPQHAKEMSINI